MASMRHRSLTSPNFPPLPNSPRPPSHSHSKPPPFLNSYNTLSKPSFFPLLANATPRLSRSSLPTSIFLPLLEEQEDEEEKTHLQESPEEKKEKEEEEESLMDPILKFFKSRTSTQDPPKEGRFSLQKNRRSSWRLAPQAFSSEPEPEPESEPPTQTTQEEENPVTHRETSTLVEEIMRIARNLPENTTLGEKLVGFEGKLSEKECVELLGLMGEEQGMVRSCLYLYEWMGLQEPSLVTPRACTVLFPVLGKAQMPNELLVLFRNLPRVKEFRDVHVYNSVISALLSCGRYDDALEVYEAMEVDNIRPDHVTCSIMITVLRKSGCSAKEAWKFFERMNRKEVKWSPEVLGALVKAFCDEGLQKEALIIQMEMEKRGIKGSTVVYNTLMNAYCKSNRVEEAEGLFVEMKAKGLKPTPATFNVLMDAYSRRMQPKIVEKLLLEMQEEGLDPNAISYTCLISAYGRQKKMSDMAADAFLRMKKVGIRPTSHSYTALIHAYSVSGWHEKAYLAFENMEKEGIRPSIETYTALLDAFRRAGDTEMLLKIWKMMIREKVEGTQVTFNILLDGFAKQGHYIEARDVISEFGKLGLHPTVMTYNMLMNAYARGGRDSKLPQLLKEMAALNIKPDSVTYMTMIYAYVRVHDFRRAFFYHKQMVKAGQVPDAQSYEKLRAILKVKAATKNRKDKSAILGVVNSKFGSLKDKKKRKKDEFWKNKIKRGSNMRRPG